MSNIPSYLKIIEHDFKLLDLLTGERPNHLKNEDFSDWEITIMYYITCIYLKAVCQLFDKDIQDHYTLKRQINTLPELIYISKSYRHLEEASRDARYEGRTFPHKYIIERLLPKFYSIRDCAVNLFKKYNISNIPEVDPQTFLKRLQNN
ncbi:MAG: hypothetical protein AABY84_12170 [Candidatus Firestonebacteria bacterium]